MCVMRTWDMLYRFFPNCGKITGQLNHTIFTSQSLHVTHTYIYTYIQSYKLLSFPHCSPYSKILKLRETYRTTHFTQSSLFFYLFAMYSRRVSHSPSNSHHSFLFSRFPFASLFILFIILLSLFTYLLITHHQQNHSTFSFFSQSPLQHKCDDTDGNTLRMKRDRHPRHETACVLSHHAELSARVHIENAYPQEGESKTTPTFFEYYECLSELENALSEESKAKARQVLSLSLSLYI